MSDLADFLQSQGAQGEYQGSGEFLISLKKAREKRTAYALAEPELWIIRLLQGLCGLQVSQVSITQSRRGLQIQAVCPGGIPAEFSLFNLFRQNPDSDPRPAIQDSIWGAIGKGLRVKLWWVEQGETRGFLIDNTELEMSTEEREVGQWDLVVEVEPAKNFSKLLRMFGKADFSGEFQAISTRGLLVPFGLTIDSKPLELASSFFSRGQQNWEIRFHRATDGPRLRGGLRSQFLARSQTVHFTQAPDKNGVDALFVLSTSWNPQSAKWPMAHWVKDGFIVESEPLGDRASHLHLELYLSADELNTDLSGLGLVSDKAKRERLQDIELQACLSLASHSLCWNPELPQPPTKQVSEEIGHYFAGVFARSSLAGKQLQKFQNITKLAQTHRRNLKAENRRRSLQYRTELANYQAELKRLGESSTHESLTNLAELRKRDAAALAHNLGSSKSGGDWARIDSSEVVEKLDGFVEGTKSRSFTPERPVLNRLVMKELLGEVYIRMPRYVVGAAPSLASLHTKRRKRTRP